ncbi:hypothetical protein K4F52_009410 [Lecanicillium sp. MT-2017a]|nr:hypothetical protein K4F52_009410 [Lecanicillium sp. MT-2017a]
MALSEEQVQIIAAHPLNDLLARFPPKLRDLKQSNKAWHTDIAALLGALIISPAADSLLLSDGYGNVAERLFAIRQKEVQGSSLKFNQLQPLVDAVVTNSPDIDIWTAVINLIEAVNPSTPPPTTDFKAYLLQLTRYIQSIFNNQPIRHFVYTFTIKGTTIELWIFDCSRAYSSSKFDIYCKPKKFAKVLIRYTIIDDKAIDIDRSIK